MPGGDCHGTGPEHCCYIEGELCPFAELNTEPGRRWTCGLRREAPNWRQVHRSTEYQTVCAPVWAAHGIPDCGDWRGGSAGQCCYGEWPDPQPGSAIPEHIARPPAGVPWRDIPDDWPGRRPPPPGVR